MKPPYIPPPHDHVLETKGECRYCGGPVDLMVDESFCCRCCSSQGKSLDAMVPPPPPRRVETTGGDQIAKYMGMMQNGYAMRLLSDGKAMELENFAHVIALNKREDKINICVLMMRPGAAEAVGVVQSNVFPSDDANLSDAWEVRIMQWEGLVWEVISIDEQYLSEVAKYFLACGFRIVDGVPTMLEGQNVRQFPIHTAKTYTLENLPPEQAVDVDIKGGASEELPAFTNLKKPDTGSSDQYRRPSHPSAVS